MKAFSLLLILLLTVGCCAAQKSGQARIDSLLGEVPEMKEDIRAARLLDVIAGCYNTINPDEGMRWAEKELRLSRKIDYKTGVGNAYNNIGNNYQAKGENPQALDAYFKALRVWEDIGQQEGIGVTSGNIGIVYKVLGNNAQSLRYHLKALGIAEQMHDKDRMQAAMGNIANVYQAQGRYDDALAYHQRALGIATSLNDKWNMMHHTGNIGATYASMKLYATALAYDYKGLQLAKALGDGQSVAANLGNIGEAYIEIARDSATPKQDSLVAAGRAANLERGIDYLRRGIAASRESQFTEAIPELSQYLSDALALKGDYRGALAAYRQFTDVKDSLYNIENNSRIAALETQRELELKDKQIIIDRLAVAKKRNERVLFGAGFMLLMVVVVIIIRNVRLATARELSENKLNALQARMNPHFIFNSLSSIQSLILNDEKEQSMDYLSEFSILMRQILDSSGQSKVSLKTEIDMLRSYVELEHLRFDGFERNITVANDINEEAVEVPGMVVQPFVENAILHGLISKGSNGKLEITFEYRDRHIICTVEDNGVGRAASGEINAKRARKRQSHGTSIATNRLTMLNDKKRGLVNTVTYIDKVENGIAAGTKVIIELPVL